MVDDDAVIRKVQQGDLNEFGKLIDAHVRRLRTVIALQLPIPDLIDEIAHETFIFAYRNIHEFQPGTSFFAWLQAIARNLTRAAAQRYRREQANIAKYVENRLLDLSETAAFQKTGGTLEHLETCLEQLPATSRELLDMKYRYSHPAGHIAQLLKQSTAWVRTTLFRIRKQLKDCIETKLMKGQA